MALMEEKAPSTEALTRKLVEILTDNENENDVGQLCFKEETIEKVMQELYKEIIMASPSSSTTASNVVQQQQQLQPQNESMELQVVDQQEKKTGDFNDEDDEWLARVLTWPQPQLLDTTTDWFSF